MAVNWSWKHKRGEIHYYDTKFKKHFKLNLYGGNMMFCILYEWKELDEKDNKVKSMYNFIIWFDDLQHLKRVLKDQHDFFKRMLVGHQVKTLRKFRLKVNDDNKYESDEMLKVARLLTKYGYKVEVY